MTQYRKVKSTAKQMMSRGLDLDQKILDTLYTCSSIVGSTLGPGGMSVIIERYENLPPIITKDGVSVFKSLGFSDPTAQTLLEAVRQAAEKTAKEAGDGTTTATVLSYPIAKFTKEFCNKNPNFSPQKVVRILNTLFRDKMGPSLKNNATKPKLTDNKDVLHAVAKVSGNGDVALADAVMQCFDIVGDEGNVTLEEGYGQGGYRVKKIDGYPLGMGYEDCAAKFYQDFINTSANQSCTLEKPLFILYYGQIGTFSVLEGILGYLSKEWAQGKPFMEGGYHAKNIVLVATKYSEEVLAELALNFSNPNTINIYPMLAPLSPIATGQYDFMLDVAALTGGIIFDPLKSPLPGMNDPVDVSKIGYGPTLFEAFRFRSNIIGFRESELIEIRSEEISKQLEGDVSDLERAITSERLAKLNSGIAKLTVLGSSDGETKEKRDRAEDAICAVRGTLKHGALPAGGWGLMKILVDLQNDATLTYEEKMIVDEILTPSLLEPVNRLYKNAGIVGDQLEAQIAQSIEFVQNNTNKIFDLLQFQYVDAYEAGLLDSLPAVYEALKNSLSISTLMGTCGGTVVFKRDDVLERQEAKEVSEFIKDLG